MILFYTLLHYNTPLRTFFTTTSPLLTPPLSFPHTDAQYDE